MNFFDRMTTDPGVYLMKDKEGKVIYVGKAKNLKVRVKQYFAPGRDTREMIPFLVSQIASIDPIVVENEKEALLLENTLIKKYKPKFNALLKDDKSFIHLKINKNHTWPRIQLVRFKGKIPQDGLYFGPYTNAYAARETLDLLHRLFPLRQCSDEELKRRTKPCLLYSIKRCIAPCVKKCTQEEYQTLLSGAIHFLKGHDQKILKNLYQEMEQASQKLQFEKAAALLKTIRQIEHVTEKKGVVVKASTKDCDVLSLYQEGPRVLLVQLLFREGKLTGSEHYLFSNVAETEEEILSSFLLQFYQDKQELPQELLLPFSLPQAKLLSEILSLTIFVPKIGEKKKMVELAHKNAKMLFTKEKTEADSKEKLLLDLQDRLKLSRYPKRIECFDTSNISGTDSVASMVAFTDGEKESRRGRLYKIKTVSYGDDYSAMKELLLRRLTRAKQENDLPDLLILDGGKGQLNLALQILQDLDLATLDVIALAKENSRHDKGMTQEKVFLPYTAEPLILDKASSLLFFLQKIRDEAHQRAISFHRKKRSERSLSSALDSITGIGPIKQKRLLQIFGSLKKIQEAPEEELLKVKGITKRDVERLRHHRQ